VRSARLRQLGRSPRAIRMTPGSIRGRMSSPVSPRPTRHRPLRPVVLLFLTLAIPACSGGKTYSFPKVRIGCHGQSGRLAQRGRGADVRLPQAFHFAYFTVEHNQFDDIVGFSFEENGSVYEPGAEGIPGRSS
jgi:hypothetical protein